MDLFSNEIICPDERASIEVAKAFVACLEPGDVVLLFGEVGSGKTFMCAQLVAALGGDERLVGSPSFTLVNSYPISFGLFYHIDLYRLRGVVDEDDIDQDLWMEPGEQAVSFIEWAERLDGWLPEKGFRCHLRHLDQGRAVRFERLP